MRCINCGAPLDDENAIFCKECYTKEILSNKEEEKDMARRNNLKNPKKKQNIFNKFVAWFSGLKPIKKVIISASAAILIIVLVFSICLSSCLGNLNNDTLSGDLGIHSGADLPFTEDVKNIALYGLDTREDNNVGRSDAIIVLSIDKKNKEIKLTSIARDTYITFENGKHNKITNAWAYGKAELAVKTLNRNLKLDVTDYVSVNFFQFADIIDYIGGVTIDVDESEMKVMNKTYIPYIRKSGIKCPYIKKTGVQRLNGGQALAYARNRYTGSDIARGNRQREVLSAMYDEVKKMNKLKYPKLVEMLLSECTTTLEKNEILSIGSWALFNSPQIYSLGIPNKECKAKGEYIDGGSYLVYDLNLASNIMHDFIYNSQKPVETSSVPTSSEK